MHVNLHEHAKEPRTNREEVSWLTAVINHSYHSLRHIHACQVCVLDACLFPFSVHTPATVSPLSQDYVTPLHDVAAVVLT